MSDVHTPTIGHPVPARKSKVIDDTVSHSGLNADLVQCLTDVVIETITAPGKTGVENLLGVTLVAGTQITGPISQIKLTSGVVEAHESY